MCFSPEADLVAAVAIGAVGVDTLRQASPPRDLLLKAIPITLAAHQLVEVFVWWGERGAVAPEIGHAAGWLYLLAAFALPVLLPSAVLLSERDAGRRVWMSGFVALGAVVSFVLVGALLRTGFEVSARPMHLHYRVEGFDGFVVSLLYVVAVCGAPLLSRRRIIVWLGILNLAMAAAIGWTVATGLISLWCVAAAVTSALIDLQFHRDAPKPESGHADLRVTTPGVP